MALYIRCYIFWYSISRYYATSRIVSQTGGNEWTFEKWGHVYLNQYHEFINGNAGTDYYDTLDQCTYPASRSAKPFGDGTTYCLGGLRLGAEYVSYWFYRVNVYSATYTQYTKMFEYMKSTSANKESASAPSGDGISNIQHWVRYIPK